MKKTITFLMIIMALGYTQAQAPTLLWQKTLGGANTDYGQSTQQTTDGGYIVAGYTNSVDGDVTANHGGNDYWIAKISATGTLQWQKTLGGTGDDQAYSIRQTTDGGFVVAGFSNSTDGDITGNHGGYDYWVVKIDGTGTLQWQKTLGGTANDWAYSVQQTSEGGYIVAGNTSSTNGDVTGNHGLKDDWVVKLDTSGTLQWQKTYGGSSDEFIFNIEQTTDGGYIIGGSSASTNGDISGLYFGGHDYWVVKINATGTLQWQNPLGGNYTDVGTSIRQTTDGGYIFLGRAVSGGYITGNHGGWDYWVVKLNATGAVQWQKSFGGTGNEIVNSIQQTSDDGYILAGYTDSNNGNVTGNHGGWDYWVIKLKADTGLSTIEFSNKALIVYPNPASQSLSIQLPEETSINKIIITDISGKIVNEVFQNSSQIDVSNLSQGMYIVEVYSGDKKFTGKFIKE